MMSRSTTWTFPRDRGEFPLLASHLDSNSRNTSVGVVVCKDRLSCLLVLSENQRQTIYVKPVGYRACRREGKAHDPSFPPHPAVASTEGALYVGDTPWQLESDPIMVGGTPLSVHEAFFKGRLRLHGAITEYGNWTDMARAMRAVTSLPLTSGAGAGAGAGAPIPPSRAGGSGDAPRSDSSAVVEGVGDNHGDRELRGAGAGTGVSVVVCKDGRRFSSPTPRDPIAACFDLALSTMVDRGGEECELPARNWKACLESHAACQGVKCPTSGKRFKELFVAAARKAGASLHMGTRWRLVIDDADVWAEWRCKK